MDYFIYKNGIIIDATSFRNEYDGHTLTPALKQVEQCLGKSPQTATVDRGYKGNTKIGETQILLPKPFTKTWLSQYQQTKLKKYFRRRAAIKPIIGHLKSNYGLKRNFYKGIIGDVLNVMLSAAAFNFKRMMNKWEAVFLYFLQNIFITINNLCFVQINRITKLKMPF